LTDGTAPRGLPSFRTLLEAFSVEPLATSLTLDRPGKLELGEIAWLAAELKMECVTEGAVGRRSAQIAIRKVSRKLAKGRWPDPPGLSDGQEREKCSQQPASKADRRRHSKHLRRPRKGRWDEAEDLACGMVGVFSPPDWQVARHQKAGSRAPKSAGGKPVQCMVGVRAGRRRAGEVTQSRSVLCSS